MLLDRFLMPWFQHVLSEASVGKDGVLKLCAGCKVAVALKGSSIWMEHSVFVCSFVHEEEVADTRAPNDVRELR